LAAVVVLLLACGGREKTGGRAGSDDGKATSIVQRDCSPNSGAPIRVAEDSIGSLDLGASLRTLSAICPVAHDTVQYGEDNAYPAVVFPFKGLTVVASQYLDSLDLDKPADTWIVRGENGYLPGGVPLTASWEELRKAYGQGLADGEGGVTVMFCTHPHMFVDLDAAEDVLPPGLTAELSRIPGDAKIVKVVILPQRPAGWKCS